LAPALRRTCVAMAPGAAFASLMPKINHTLILLPFLHATVYPHIMNAMEEASLQPRVGFLTRVFRSYCGYSYLRSLVQLCLSRFAQQSRRSGLRHLPSRDERSFPSEIVSCPCAHTASEFCGEFRCFFSIVSPERDARLETGCSLLLLRCLWN
jgi:hypothetical protein